MLIFMRSLLIFWIFHFQGLTAQKIEKMNKDIKKLNRNVLHKYEHSQQHGCTEILRFIYLFRAEKDLKLEDK